MALNEKFENKLLFYFSIFNPKIIYDIGAYHGDFSIFIKKIFPDTQIIMFEANSKCIPFLKPLNIPFYISLLSDIDNKEVIFYEPINGQISTGSSIYKENSTFFDNSIEHKMKTITLDTLIKKYNIIQPDLIKIDVQGSELDIIKGLTFRPFIYILEASLIKFNNGSPLFGEIIKYMIEIGYRCCDILDNLKISHTNINGKKVKRYYQMDLLFIRTDLCDNIFFDQKVTFENHF